jgi:hypothetical protein
MRDRDKIKKELVFILVVLVVEGPKKWRKRGNITTHTHTKYGDI